MTERYQIRVLGRLGPVLRAAFGDVRCEMPPRQTLIRGELSRDELRLLLERMDKLGLRLVQLDCQRS